VLAFRSHSSTNPMTHGKVRLAIEFGLALAVCAIIAAFDRPLTGLVGAGLCVLIFAIRAAVGHSRSPTRHSRGGFATGSSERERAVTAEPPLHYDPTNTLHYPPDR